MLGAADVTVCEGSSREEKKAAACSVGFGRLEVGLEVNVVLCEELLLAAALVACETELLAPALVVCEPVLVVCG